jgi:capsular polysaccharide biosynthesis protein
MPSKWQTGWSLKRLSEDTEVSSVGNLLQLTVKANNPEEATDVANAWAQVFVDIANAAFQQPATAIEVIEDQVNSSRLEYDSAQKALEDFLQSSMIEELQLEIDIRESAIEDIRFSFQNSTKEQLTALLNARDQTNQSINAARALQERIAYLGDGETVDAATQYALLLLELNTFKTFDRFANLEEGTFTSGTNQYTLQINIPEINTATMTASEARLASDQLIAASQSLLEGLEELITEASTDTLFAPDLVAQTSTISQLQIELDQIKADLESEESRLKELIEARDLALDNYNTLSRKASEINIETQTSQTEVVIAAKAVVPDVRSGPNHIINIGAGTALGLIASLFVAFIRAHLDESLAQEQIKRTSI